MRQQRRAGLIAVVFPIRILLALGALAWAGRLSAAAFVPPDRDPQWQTSLNGEWTFKLNGPAAEFVQPDFDDSAWAKIRVPGHWEMQGFEEPIYKEPREGQGLYRRKFEVPEACRGRRLILRFDGVRGNKTGGMLTLRSIPAAGVGTIAGAFRIVPLRSSWAEPFATLLLPAFTAR
jgi:hypothetical protein